MGRRVERDKLVKQDMKGMKVVEEHSLDMQELYKDKQGRMGNQGRSAMLAIHILKKQAEKAHVEMVKEQVALAVDLAKGLAFCESQEQ